MNFWAKSTLKSTSTSNSKINWGTPLLTRSFPLKVCSLPPNSKETSTKTSYLNGRKKSANLRKSSKNFKLVSTSPTSKKNNFKGNSKSSRKIELAALKSYRLLHRPLSTKNFNSKKKNQSSKNSKPNSSDLKSPILKSNKDSRKLKNSIFMLKKSTKTKDWPIQSSAQNCKNQKNKSTVKGSSFKLPKKKKSKFKTNSKTSRLCSKIEKVKKKNLKIHFLKWTKPLNSIKRWSKTLLKRTYWLPMSSRNQGKRFKKSLQKTSRFMRKINWRNTFCKKKLLNSCIKISKSLCNLNKLKSQTNDWLMTFKLFQTNLLPKSKQNNRNSTRKESKSQNWKDCLTKRNYKWWRPWQKCIWCKTRC